MSVELLRARHRPLTRLCALWFAVSGAVFSQMPLAAWSPDVAHMTVVGAFGAAFFGVVPAVIAGLASGAEDRRLGTDKELRLAGVSELQDLVARCVAVMLVVVALWLAAVLAALTMSCALAVCGLRAWTAGHAADSTGLLHPAQAFSTVGMAVLLAVIALPLLAAGGVAMADLLRSQVRAAVFWLGWIAVYWVCIGLVNPHSGLAWIARLTPIGAALQLATGQTFPGDEAYGVGLGTATAIAAAWSSVMVGVAFWSASHRSAAQGDLGATRAGDNEHDALGVGLGDESTRSTSTGAPGRRRWSVARGVLAIGAACVALVALGAVAPPLLGRLPGGMFDAVYQRVAGETDCDAVLSLAVAVRDRRWTAANALLDGGDIRSAAPDFVRCILASPRVQISFVRQSATGDRLLPGVCVTSGRDGARAGRTFLFSMSFSNGRWHIHRIVDDRRLRDPFR